MTVSKAMPPVNEPVVDRYRKWSPVWYPWIKRLLDLIGQNASDIETTQQQITTLETTVDGNTASIEEILESTDGISARYSLDINVNGRIVGSIKLDGSPGYSEMAVLANKFIIVHPSDDNTEIQAFIVGLVNGVSTVGINGNLLVDGTILARHIQAGSITASKLTVGSLDDITEDAGTITAGRLVSPNGKMDVNLNSVYIRMTS